MATSKSGSQKNILVGFVVVVVLLLFIGAVAGLRSSKKTTSTTEASSSVPATTYDNRIGTPDKGNSYTLVIDNHALKSGPSKIVVKKGASVKINILAVGDEVGAKLDGYDVNTESDPHAPGAFSFIADKTGTFAFYALGESNPDGVTPRAEFKLGTVVVE